MKELQNKLSLREMSTAILTSPDNLTGTQRRRAMRMREKVVLVGTEPKPELQRLQERFSRTPVRSLVSQIARFARRAAHCKYLLEKMSPDSVFAQPMRDEQTRALTAFAVASGEWQKRTNPIPEPILAPNE